VLEGLDYPLIRALQQLAALVTKKYLNRPYCLPYHKAREYAIREAGKSHAQSAHARMMYR
jgi:hypothetical protein